MNSSAGSVPTVGWEHEPNQRGTLGLVWSCLTVLFICVWTVQHFSQIDVENRGWNLYTCMDITKRVCFPEIWVGNAVNCWLATCAGCRSLNRKDQRWAKTPLALASVDGLKVQGKRPKTDDENEYIEFPSTRLDPSSLGKLINDGVIRQDHISVETIKARTQSDALIKAITAFQSLWLAVDIIARLSTHLPISQLEVLSLAYIAACLVAYGFWWDVPQNVCEPLTVDIGTVNRRQYEMMLGSSREHQPDMDLKLALITGIVAFVFGGIHFVAWQQYFPSRAEEIIWWTAAGITAVFPGIVMTIAYRTGTIDFDEIVEHMKKKRLMASLGLLVGIYLVARLAALTVCFTALRSQPKTLYKQVRWPNAIPHI